MIRYCTNRTEITRTVLRLVYPDWNDESGYGLSSALRTWWVNLRDSGGLGLTATGHQMFEKAKLEHYTFDVDITLSLMPVIGLRCDRAILCPFFLHYTGRKRYISVYDSRVAMMIQLHGSFDSYLTHLESNND